MQKKLNVLVIGSGGREHALVWKLAQSPRLEKLYCAPGNAGIAQKAECVPIAADDLPALLAFAKSRNIDFTVVGPEVPLVAGIVDLFRQDGLSVFGPSKKAALLEGSKIFTKRLMEKYKIPTAPFKVFTNAKEAKTYLEKASYPLVLKADGLAAGKGVIIAKDKRQAEAAVTDILERKIFGEAGDQLLIEDCLQGQEVSVLAITDGKQFVVFPAAQDHKRIFNNDEGPNTGGMGAYSPAPVLDETMLQRIKEEVLERTLKAMHEEGRPFQGVLYAGLMLTAQGPQVLEFNVRFGDPEAQVILPRLKGDLLQLLLDCTEGRLKRSQVAWSPEAVVCVVMAAGGYPGSYPKGDSIVGLDKLENLSDVVVFHAGTKQVNGTMRTAGGRVLGITAMGKTLQEAVTRVYEATGLVQFNGAQYRKDIARRAFASAK